MRVLIVDSSKEQRQLIVAALCELTNVTIVGAVGRLHAALYAIAEASPDVLITDHELGGDDAAGLIAAAQRCIHPPAVIVFSSDDSPASRERAFDAGADQYVAKTAGLDGLAYALSCVPSTRRRRAGAPTRFALLGRISASFAHDLRNYHLVIGMAITRLERAGGDPRDLASIRRALDSASRLTASMLAYASGTVPDPSPVDLGIVVRELVKLFQGALPNNVTTSVSVEEVPPVRVVVSELEQLVLDLMLDAADDMTEGGELAITVRPGRDSAILELQHANGATLSRGGERIAIAHAVARRHGATLQLLSAPFSSQVVLEIPASSTSA